MSSTKVSFQEFQNLFEDDPRITCCEFKHGKKAVYVVEYYHITGEHLSLAFDPEELYMRQVYDYVKGLINYKLRSVGHAEC